MAFADGEESVRRDQQLPAIVAVLSRSWSQHRKDYAAELPGAPGSAERIAAYADRAERRKPLTDY